MQIWIVTVGWYDDQRLVGVALSSDAANMLVMKARLSGQFRDIESFGPDADTYEVAGPYAPDRVYGYNGEPV